VEQITAKGRLAAADVADSPEPDAYQQ
jgi:hypothetical protein